MGCSGRKKPHFRRTFRNGVFKYKIPRWERMFRLKIPNFGQKIPKMGCLGQKYPFRVKISKMGVFVLEMLPLPLFRDKIPKIWCLGRKYFHLGKKLPKSSVLIEDTPFRPKIPNMGFSSKLPNYGEDCENGDVKVENTHF